MRSNDQCPIFRHTLLDGSHGLLGQNIFVLLMIFQIDHALRPDGSEGGARHPTGQKLLAAKSSHVVRDSPRKAGKPIQCGGELRTEVH